jgi:hypothetical protein
MNLAAIFDEVGGSDRSAVGHQRSWMTLPVTAVAVGV